MLQAKNGDIVKVHYTGKFDDGTEFATSMNDEPLEFIEVQGRSFPLLSRLLRA
jgi:peptidylprolyl isomerase